LRDQEDPFGFGKLTYTPDVDDSRRLNTLKGSHIIISASGMAEAGRILHHLKNNIENPANLVLFVGYAAPHTLARRMMDGNKSVRIFGEHYQVKCHVKTMDYFSAHADQEELLDYMELMPPKKLKHIFLVHGDEEQAIPFKKQLENRGYKDVHFPASEETYQL
jgi:metallo-beta-lactamase family protein